jgi:hypothetical protein
LKSTFSYFRWSFISAIAAVLFGFWYAGPAGAWTIAVLAILETSLSFDNAVVNASVLNGWSSKFWRNLFIYFGIFIAVFVMRLYFPMLIVSLSTGLGIKEAFYLALDHPAEYATALTSAHHEVAAFGGCFLMMVALQFFLDAEKECHWIPGVEAMLSKLGKYEVAVEAGISLSVLMATASLFDGVEKSEFVAAGVYGFIVYIVAKLAGQVLSDGADDGKKVAQGVGGLMYLEILDASFSFDGVIGAFAISDNLFVIMAGLGVGAMFVRSMTIYLVEKGTLSEFRYLEHGAFWAIAALAVIMFIGVKVEIPEWFTGFIGAGLIVAAVICSHIMNKREATEEKLKETKEMEIQSG